MTNHQPSVDLVLTGPKLKAIRAIRGVTQEQLATSSRVSQTAIAEFEAGKREIRTDTLRRLCDALDVRVQYIVGDTVITGP